MADPGEDPPVEEQPPPHLAAPEPAEDPPVEERAPPHLAEPEPAVVPRHCLTFFVLGVRFVYARVIRMQSTVAQWLMTKFALERASIFLFAPPRGSACGCGGRWRSSRSSADVAG